MKNLSTRWMIIASLLVAGAVLNLACGSDATTDGTGGKTGTGGSTGGGTGGSAVVHLLTYTFDSSVQGWGFDQYEAATEANLGRITPNDGGGVDAQGPDGGALAVPTLTVDNVVGSPTAGSLKVSVTFTACDQYVDPVVGITPALNLTGKTLHLKIQQTSGNFSGGVQMHTSSGSQYVYVASPVTLPTTPGTFGDGSLNLATAVPGGTTPFDPTMIVQVGVKIFSGYSCTAPYANAGEPVVFNIDTVTD